MLSDEEKKAYDNLIMLKYFTMEKEDKQAIDTILNLIEKQSKEIEELKENMRKRIIYCNELEKDLFENCSNYVVSKDKIKAEIEEIRKTHAPEDDYAESQIYILQSLLEKE